MAGQAVGNDERLALLESLEELLRPLMRTALMYGLTYMDLLELVRGLYIGTIRDQLKEQKRPVTVARLALMAGVTRGEAENILSNSTRRRLGRSQSIGRIDQLSLMLTVWHDDKRFSTPYGAPLDLSLQPERGFRTFDDLVKTACPDLSTELVLDELVAAGCVQVHEEKFVRCISRTFIPAGVDVSRILRLGRLVGALSSTLAHNLSRAPGQPAYFERSVLSESTVSEEYRDEVLGYLRDEGQSFLDKVDRWATEREQRHKQDDGKRYGVGLFFYEEHPLERDVQSNGNGMGLLGNG